MTAVCEVTPQMEGVRSPYGVLSCARLRYPAADEAELSGINLPLTLLTRC